MFPHLHSHCFPLQSACDNTEHHRAAFWASDSLLFNSSTHFILILDQPAGALKKPYHHPSRASLLIEVLPCFYDRDLNNSVTPSLPVDFPLSWNFNLISPKFFLPIIRGTFLLIRFIIFLWTLSLFYLSPLMWKGARIRAECRIGAEQQVCVFLC